jgi:hypothetical protein
MHLTTGVQDRVNKETVSAELPISFVVLDDTGTGDWPGQHLANN